MHLKKVEIGEAELEYGYTEQKRDAMKMVNSCKTTKNSKCT